VRLHWLALVAACGASPPPAPAPIDLRPPASPAPTIDPHAALSARARADAALHEGVPLDYERPFKTAPVDRSATAKLFADACSLGDKHACIVDAQLVTAADRFHTVEANCRAGDLLSCRVLPLDEHSPRYPDLPGAMSRRVECHKPELAAPCEVDALHKECAAGFPVACDELNSAVPELPMTAAEVMSWARLSARGCKGGIASECVNVTQYGSDGDQLEVAQRLCELQPAECISLAWLDKKRNDVTGERDSFERACEYGPEHVAICAGLASSYLDGTFQEPVPGRGQALIDWACPKLVKGDRARFPACTRVTGG